MEGGELRLVGVHDLVHDVGNLGVVWLARVDAQGQPLARVRLDVEEERPALVLDLGAPGGRSGRGLAAAEPGPSGEVGLEGAVPRGGGSCVAVAGAEGRAVEEEDVVLGLAWVRVRARASVRVKAP